MDNTFRTIDLNYLETLGTSPFYLTRLAKNREGRLFVTKKTNLNQPDSHSTQSTFQSNYSRDLRTSIYYGHHRVLLNQQQADNYLVAQQLYLSKASNHYNISGCHLEFERDGDLFLMYDYIEGVDFQRLHHPRKLETFLAMIPSLLRALSAFPHGDLSFGNIILHQNEKKFSLIDPSVNHNGYFATNSRYYPIVPPLFHEPDDRYVSYPDQLAIGLMLYELITGVSPLGILHEQPFWTLHEFHNIWSHMTSDIESTISKIPDEWGIPFCFESYLEAIKRQLRLSLVHESDFAISLNHGNETSIIMFPDELFQIPAPNKVNSGVSEKLSDFCMSLIFYYEPFEYYAHKAQKLLED